MPNFFKSLRFRIVFILLSSILCTSCATSVGMAAAAVTSATITVGTAVVKAPFKLIGMATDDDDEENGDEEE